MSLSILAQNYCLYIEIHLFPGLNKKTLEIRFYPNPDSKLWVVLEQNHEMI